jgi:hypothetical protein
MDNAPWDVAPSDLFVEITVSLERSITPDRMILLRTIGQLPGGTVSGQPLSSAVSLTIKIQGMSSQRCTFVERTTISFVTLAYAVNGRARNIQGAICVEYWFWLGNGIGLAPRMTRSLRSEECLERVGVLKFPCL